MANEIEKREEEHAKTTQKPRERVQQNAGK